MKIKLLFLAICIVASFNTYAKRVLTGTWQEQTNKTSSAFLDRYYFNNADSTFEFFPTEYNGLNRVLSFGGKFRLEKDTIFFNVTFIREYIGGYPTRSRITTMSDKWELTEGVINLKKLEGIKEESVVFKIGYDNGKKTDYISIDGNLFFKTQDE
ncbi:MAG: hypothetical protein JXA53_00655 [Bacteroidales bacterium]|nr:hypothetical protein [Bacteroidales bacterium]